MWKHDLKYNFFYKRETIIFKKSEDMANKKQFKISLLAAKIEDT